MSHELWILAHVLLLVYWLGTDLGVFYLSFHVRRPTLPVETRAALSKAMFALDLAPRVCLVLTLPVGLTLAADLGISPVRGIWLGLAWAASLLWLAAVLTIYKAAGSKLGNALTRIDAWFRALVCATLLVAALASFATGYPFETGRLALKVALFALIVALGLGIRLVLAPFGPALRRLLGHGPEPESEKALSGALKRAYPLVLAIWASLIAAAYLGLT